MAADAELEVILTPGPRRAWDVRGKVDNPEGALSGIWYRGFEQLKYAVADILRCIDIGVRGFLVVGEGLLIFKVSLAESYSGFMRFMKRPEMVRVTTPYYSSNDGR